jgi:proteasome lid subunit RPN8/RPN11
MQLLLPPELATRLTEALAKAGRREIGGILMGEHLGEDMFRVRELTIQSSGGSFAAFIRNITEFLSPLHRYFAKTKHEYSRFNYLGEWHSHPSFTLRPSDKDHFTMYTMVTDPQLGAYFIVLLLVKLGSRGELQLVWRVINSFTMCFHLAQD